MMRVPSGYHYTHAVGNVRNLAFDPRVDGRAGGYARDQGRICGGLTFGLGLDDPDSIPLMWPLFLAR